MADTPRTDVELLAELGPLVAVIADKLAAVPVRLGPGGTDDLVTALTLAVAVYAGRHVLPADAHALANPPRPTETGWVVEAQWSDRTWRPYGAARSTRDEAHEDFAATVNTAREAGPAAREWSFRLVRATTTYAIEAEHTPEAQP